MKKAIARFVREDEGQDLIEYAFLAVAIGLAAYTVLQGLGTGISSQFNNINSQITGS